ncbi:MAG TPA: aspartate-semialdehyde dehydrogenase [Candidatus Dormibacteraeota bacterium]|nr:aspartate-semialdehyde dehydrogenase [Candidatus Dormibacteraeota bacterium]HEX2681075.1 aspartate-semialdehyde dehydrogenase [Candidatus Dormibacteraeota bacterium]
MPTSKRLNVAVVGATGLVGTEMLKILVQRNFPYENVRVFASERSAGREVQFNSHKLKLEKLADDSFKDVELVMFAAGADVSLLYGPIAAESGALVIDKSSAWRMKENVPLVVPEVNANDIRDNEGIIASPNCTTIPLTMVLEPLRQKVGVKRVTVSTYQSASGAGRALVDELEEQTEAIAAHKEPEVAVTSHQLAYNVIPGGWKPQQYGYNEEELKLVYETRKILHEPELPVAATCVRVPVPVGHGESVFIETGEAIEPDDVRALLERAPGVVVSDDPAARLYPTPHDVAGKDEVYVGRIRKDMSCDKGIALWIVSDNLRKGAALNAVQIAEKAIEMGVFEK